MKRSRSGADYPPIASEDDFLEDLSSDAAHCDYETAEVYCAAQSTVLFPRRSKGVKALKEELKALNQQAVLARAQADLAAARLRHAEALADQNVLALFMMPLDIESSSETREYLALRRKYLELCRGEELRKLRRRLSAEGTLVEEPRTEELMAGSGTTQSTREEEEEEEEGEEEGEVRLKKLAHLFHPR